MWADRGRSVLRAEWYLSNEKAPCGLAGKNKGRSPPRRGSRPCCFVVCPALAGAAACGAATIGAAAAARAATVTANRIFGIDREPVVGHVDSDVTGFGHERLFYQKGESTRLKRLILVVRLIQSQCQPRAGSAACCKINPDGRGFLVLEVALELLLGAFCYFNHSIPPVGGRELKR